MIEWAASLPRRPRHAHLYEEFEALVQEAAKPCIRDQGEIRAASVCLLKSIAAEIEFVVRPFGGFPNILMALQSGTYELSREPNHFVLRRGYQTYLHRLYQNLALMAVHGLIREDWCRDCSQENRKISQQLCLPFFPLELRVDLPTILLVGRIFPRLALGLEPITFGDEREFSKEAEILAQLGICLPPFEKVLFEKTPRGDYPPDLSMFSTEDDAIFSNLVRAIAKSRDSDAVPIWECFANDDEAWVRELIRQVA